MILVTMTKPHFKKEFKLFYGKTPLKIAAE